MNGTRHGAVMLAAIAALLAACSADGESTKAGGSGPPVTLRIGTNDVQGRPAADQIEEFARQVEARSDGRLRIEPVWEVGGNNRDDFDQFVARQVVSGELDLGVIPARAWDTEGVESLRALHAPFLVTSDALVEEIVTDELATTMLAGLDTIGVTGLALMPEGLRHLFVFGEPILTPEGFAGATVRVPTSETTYALFEAMGATPDDFAGEFPQGVSAGNVAAADSSFAFAGTLPANATVAGNLTLYPKVNSLVINTDLFDELTDDQQDILRETALESRDWAIAETVEDGKQVDTFCANGGRVVLADEAQIAAFEQAAQPVYTNLEKDEATKTVIARIRALKSQLPAPTPPTPCGSVVDTVEPVDGDETSQVAFPDGVYRMEMTAEFLMDAGVDRVTAFNHDGTWTLTFDGGEFREGPCVGTYATDNGRVTIHLGDDESCGTAANQDLFSAGWTLDGDQLRFVDVRSGHGSDLLIQTLFGGKPFTKIG